MKQLHSVALDPVVDTTAWTRKNRVRHLCLASEGGEEVTKEDLAVVILVCARVPLDVFLEGIDLQLLGVTSDTRTRSTDDHLRAQHLHHPFHGVCDGLLLLPQYLLVDCFVALPPQHSTEELAFLTLPWLVTLEGTQILL